MSTVGAFGHRLAIDRRFARSQQGRPRHPYSGTRTPKAVNQPKHLLHDG
jgi:hypothetical protein